MEVEIPVCLDEITSAVITRENTDGKALTTLFLWKYLVWGLQAPKANIACLLVLTKTRLQQLQTESPV